MASGQTVPVIAIDGPSASGKGTVARLVARALGFHYLNSGALYRTVALAALESGSDLEDESSLANIALNLMAKFDGDSVVLGDRDVTDVLHAEAVSVTASRIAALAAVRGALLERQRAFRQPPGLVADGRDMGSVVFPDAALKIFLTASPEERARRRYKQLMEKGLHANMTTLLQEIRERDARDSGRAVAPLRKGADAVLIDTTRVPVEEVVERVLALFEAAREAP
jgi:cytidylate kinase